MADADAMDKYRLLASDERHRAALTFLELIEDHDPSVTWRTIRRFISSFILAVPYLPGRDEHYPEFKGLMAITREKETQGEQPWSDLTFVDRLREACELKFNSLSELSVLGGMTPVATTKGAMPFRLPGAEFWVEPFEKGVHGEGFLTIIGPPRSGKSCAASHVCEKFIQRRPSALVITNTPMEYGLEPPWLRKAVTMSETLRAVAEAMKAEVHWLWGFDDAEVVWIKSRATTADSISLSQWARVIPKYGGGLLFVSHKRESIPSVLQDFAQAHIYCDVPGTFYISYPSFSGPVSHVPLPRVMKYREGETASLTVDIDLEKFMNEALGEKADRTTAENIVAWLDRDKKRKEQGHDAKTGAFLPKAPIQ